MRNSSEAVALKGKAKLTRDEEAKIIGQVTTNWNFSDAKNKAEANLTSAKAAKGTVYIGAPNDGTARAIADAFAADKDVKKYYITGQDAEKASIQYIIDGKQSMTVLKDVRTLVADAIAAAVAYLKGKTPARPRPTTTARSRSREALRHRNRDQGQREGRDRRFRLLARQRIQGNLVQPGMASRAEPRDARKARPDPERFPRKSGGHPPLFLYPLLSDINLREAPRP